MSVLTHQQTEAPPQPGAQYALDQPVALPDGRQADGFTYTASAGWLYGTVTDWASTDWAELGLVVEPGYPVYGADGSDSGARLLPAAR
jgi:hypothetical protein